MHQSLSSEQFDVPSGLTSTAVQATPAPSGSEIEKKAGVLLYGWANDDSGKRRLHVLAPYTEGRFGSNVKCYVLPKGKIDRDEDTMSAAFRETCEETGIDPALLLCASAAEVTAYTAEGQLPEAMQRLKRGEVIEQLTSAGYPGVTVVKLDPAPLRHRYTSGHGTQKDASYFQIEVEGIAHLQPHLKSLGEDEVARSPRVKFTTARFARQQGLPDFTTMLTMLRTGFVVSNNPETDNPAWAKYRYETLLDHPRLSYIEADYHAAHPDRPVPIETVEQWLEFVRDIPGKDFRKLEKNFKTLKDFFEVCGIVDDRDPSKVKLDTKDRPLMFYQEGAEILPAGVMLERSAQVAATNPLYACATWGDYTGPRRPSADDLLRMKTAQIAPMVELVANLAPMEIASAAIALPRNSKGIKRCEAGRDAWPSNPFGLRAVEGFAEAEVARRMDSATTERGA